MPGIFLSFFLTEISQIQWSVFENTIILRLCQACIICVGAKEGRLHIYVYTFFYLYCLMGTKGYREILRISSMLPFDARCRARAKRKSPFFRQWEETDVFPGIVRDENVFKSFTDFSCRLISLEEIFKICTLEILTS